MPTTYRIHPAIGIARVGDSPDEFFIGPERLNEYPDPPGGFKDAECRVKRQAARFRIFAHHDDGTTEEITDAEAEISWTVHVANAKGEPSDGSDGIIDPGPRTLTALNARAFFDGGTRTFDETTSVEVPLGEMRTDDAGRLLVLGGHGRAESPTGRPIENGTERHDGWLDDISDGPITASIELRDSGETPPVLGSWVVVGPPKFAPQIDNVRTMYDYLFQVFVTAGTLTAPTTTSYTDDIYPILQRAMDSAWVTGLTGNHLWSHPVTDQAMVDMIVSRAKVPGGGGSAIANMPFLLGVGLTQTQYDHLLRWQGGTYTNDWTGVPGPEPTITPYGMDQAALAACSGGSFAPGIEFGGLRYMPIFMVSYIEPFRIDHTGAGPGEITKWMANPWQSDYSACGATWWPVPRPAQVLTEPTGLPVMWDRDAETKPEMVANWAKLGFVVRQGDQHLEVERCDTASINLLTPALNFLDIPQAAMGGAREAVLPIVFEVVAPDGPLTLELAPITGPSHPQLTALTTSETVGPTAGAVATVHLWIAYRTGDVGTAIPTQTVTVTEPVSGRTWDIEIDGNTIGRRTTGVAFALDRSGSMADDRGDGQTKHDSLRQATNLFLDLMLEDDGAGIVRFNQDADRLAEVVALGDGMLTDVNRQQVRDAINGPGLDPDGATSIGDGVFEARAALDDAADPYDQGAIVVLSDGIENRSRWIADVAAEIDAATYAVGLGQPQDLSIAALQALSGNTGGYLSVTGPIVGDNRFRLQKHFLQILSDVNNTEVVLDPDGHLAAGQFISIPFEITDADSGVEVVLLTTKPEAVDFRLLSPMGQLIEPWMARDRDGLEFRLSDGASFYRLGLPFVTDRDRLDQHGTWQAIIITGKPRIEHDELDLDLLDPRSRKKRQTDWGTERRPTLPYSLVVNAYSDVAMSATLDQVANTIGAEVDLRATVTQSSLTLDDANVSAEITDPSGHQQRIVLDRGEGGGHHGQFLAAVAGAHKVRVRSSGRTRAGVRFTRERLLTAQVWHGAGQPGDRASDLRPPAGSTDPGQGGHDLCELVWCLAGPEGALTEALAERLAQYGVDIEKVWACIDTCRKGMSEGEER